MLRRANSPMLSFLTGFVLATIFANADLGGAAERESALAERLEAMRRSEIDALNGSDDVILTGGDDWSATRKVPSAPTPSSNQNGSEAGDSSSRQTSRYGSLPPAHSDSRPRTVTTTRRNAFSLDSLLENVLAPTVPPVPRSGEEHSSRRVRMRTADVSSQAPTAAMPQSTRSVMTDAAAPSTAPEKVAEEAPTELSEPQPIPVASVKRDETPKAVAEAAEKPELPKHGKEEQVLISLSGPQLSAEAAGPRTILISRAAKFVVTIRNSGDVAAKDVVVSVFLPPWAEIASTSPSQGSTHVANQNAEGQPLQWQIARLEAKSQEQLALQLIPRKSQPLDLAVQWTYAQAASRVQVEVEQPLLQMVISGPSEAVFGETKLYTLSLSNPGTGDAENVVINLLPLDGKGRVTASHKIGTLRRGESKTTQVQLDAAKEGMIVLSAQAVAEGGLKADAVKEVLVRRANLKLDVEGPHIQYAGTAATYDIRLTNAGNANGNDVTVSALLPAGSELVASKEDGNWVEQQQGTVRWDVGSLHAGQERTIKLTCRLNAPGDNELRITAQDSTDLTVSASGTTNVVARADLKLEVADPKGPVPVGENAVYEVRVVNRGTNSADGIEAATFFSDGIEPVSVKGGAHQIGEGQVVFKAIPTLPAGGEIVLTVVAKAQSVGNHVFRAEVFCRSLGTKLAAQETTHFYEKNPTAGSQRAPQSISAMPGDVRGTILK